MALLSDVVKIRSLVETAKTLGIFPHINNVLEKITYFNNKKNEFKVGQIFKLVNEVINNPQFNMRDSLNLLNTELGLVYEDDELYRYEEHEDTTTKRMANDSTTNYYPLSATIPPLKKRKSLKNSNSSSASSATPTDAPSGSFVPKKVISTFGGVSPPPLAAAPLQQSANLRASPSPGARAATDGPLIEARDTTGSQAQEDVFPTSRLFNMSIAINKYMEYHMKLIGYEFPNITMFLPTMFTLDNDEPTRAVINLEVFQLLQNIVGVCSCELCTRYRQLHNITPQSTSSSLSQGLSSLCTNSLSTDANPDVCKWKFNSVDNSKYRDAPETAFPTTRPQSTSSSSLLNEEGKKIYNTLLTVEFYLDSKFRSLNFTFGGRLRHTTRRRRSSASRRGRRRHKKTNIRRGRQL